MSNKVIVKDGLSVFAKNNESVMDSALGRMGIDVQRQAQTYVPVARVQGGTLFKEIKYIKKGKMKHRIEVMLPYAAYQERGERHDGSHKVRRYSTPGTGKHFLLRAGERISSQSLNYLKQAASLARIT